MEPCDKRLSRVGNGYRSACQIGRLSKPITSELRKRKTDKNMSCMACSSSACRDVTAPILAPYLRRHKSGRTWSNSDKQNILAQVHESARNGRKMLPIRPGRRFTCQKDILLDFKSPVKSLLYQEALSPVHEGRGM